MPRRLALLLALLVTTPPLAATAQEVVVRSTRVAQVSFDYTGPSLLAALRRHIREGDTEGARNLAGEVVQKLKAHPRLEKCCAAGAVTRLLFYAVDGSGSKTVARVVLGVDERTGHLPGISGSAQPIEDLFLAEEDGSTVSTTITVTKEEDPLLAQAADFSKTILSGLVLGSSTAIAAPVKPAPGSNLPPPDGGGTPGGSYLLSVKRATAPRDLELSVSSIPTTLGTGRKLHVDWRRTEVPHKRAALAIVDRLAIPDGVALLRAQLKDAPEEMALDPRLSECGKAVAGAVAELTLAKTNDRSCAPGLVGAPASCQAALRDAITTAFLSQGSACPASATSVARVFEDLVGVMPGTTTSQVTLKNVPKSRFSLGLGTAVIGKAWIDEDRPKAQVQSGSFAVSPLTRTMAMAVVNWHPAGFMPQSASTDGAREQFRFVGAVAIAPAAGLGAGVGWGLTRQIALNGGVMFLLADTVAREKLGKAATEAVPLSPAGIPVLFVGASFRVK